MCTFKTRKEVLNNNDLFLQKMQGIKGFIHKICSVWRRGEGVGPTVTSRWAPRVKMKKSSKPSKLAKNTVKTGKVA